MASRTFPFLDRVRNAIRVRHYSIRTEQVYRSWIRQFILHHGKRHPQEMGAPEVGAFLTHLAVERNVSAATQNQALNALVFLYEKVLEQPLGDISGVVRAAAPKKLPVVLTPNEVGRVLANLSGVHWVVACLQYGSGLRLLESVRLRVKDLDFAHRAIMVRQSKGGKDRVVTMPDDLVAPLRTHSEGQFSQSNMAAAGCWNVRTDPRPFPNARLSGANAVSVRAACFAAELQPLVISHLMHAQN